MRGPRFSFAAPSSLVPLTICAIAAISTSAVVDESNADAHDGGGETIAKFGAGEHFSFAERRFLLYDVNRGEGFNLRRDVYMRVANTVRLLRERGHNYVLVLPPWGGLYHWCRRGEPPTLRQRWRRFFDVRSLARFVPVVEFDEAFLAENGGAIDLVLCLQHYAEGWDADAGFQLKYDERPCLDADRHYYRRQESGKVLGAFFGYGDENVFANALKCLSIQGQSSTLADAILTNFSKPMSVLVDRAETILHDHFGDKFYWRARRSMRYAKHLVDVADEFRRREFNSIDASDGVAPLADSPEWDERRPRLSATSGGDYLAVHWRRADFLGAHGPHLPSVEGTARQIFALCRRLRVNSVFLSTDAEADELVELTAALVAASPTAPLRVHRFDAALQLHRDDNSAQQERQLSEGEISIVDQLICAHARFFVGTHLSTFSFRIHEDREILGFAPETTFNRLCPDTNDETSENGKTHAESEDARRCEQPARWTIVY